MVTSSPHFGFLNVQAGRQRRWFELADQLQNIWPNINEMKDKETIFFLYILL